MSNRRPAEPHYSGRATGALPRSPAERLEPTRPAARRVRRRRFGGGSSASRGVSRVVSGVFTLLLLLMALAGAAALGLRHVMNAPGPLTASKKVVVPRGDGAGKIAERLEREGVISNGLLFMAGYQLYQISAWTGGRPASLKAGEYQIPQAASVRQVIDILVEGKTLFYRVTIPEGLTSYQIVERLKADSNLSGETAEVPAEGALLPASYDVRRGDERQKVVDMMRGEAKKLADKLWAQRQKDLPLKTWEEAIVLASIVEKETGRNDERERVAAVFINRLRKGMRLDSDPTILYGVDGGKVAWGRSILKSEIGRKTAHNTYQINGLPPTPICNPGRAAIEAVLNPANTKELYFVADGKGGHVFAETLKEHNPNVQKYRAAERERAREKAKASEAGATPAAPPEKGKGPNEGPWTSTTEPAAKSKK